MKVLVIDNYDSFVYNLVQYIGEQGAEPVVFRNNKVTLEQLEALKPDRIVISPRPRYPEDERTLAFVNKSADPQPHTPTLGVCRASKE